MKISKINRAEALCIALLAVFFIIGTAAGSISLATIPPQISQSSVSADTPGGNQDSDEARPEDHGTQPHKESKYALVCGIVGVIMDKATGKLVFSPPANRSLLRPSPRVKRTEWEAVSFWTFQKRRHPECPANFRHQN